MVVGWSGRYPLDVSVRECGNKHSCGVECVGTGTAVGWGGSQCASLEMSTVGAPDVGRLMTEWKFEKS